MRTRERDEFTSPLYHYGRWELVYCYNRQVDAMATVQGYDESIETVKDSETGAEIDLSPAQYDEVMLRAEEEARDDDWYNPSFDYE